MVTKVSSAKQNFLLASELRPLSFIKYQLVFQVSDDIRYLKSFNILSEEGAIIKKIYLKNLVHFDETSNIEQIIIEYLFPEESKSSPSYYKDKKAKKKKCTIDLKAKDDAVNYLFNELGL